MLKLMSNDSDSEAVCLGCSAIWYQGVQDEHGGAVATVSAQGSDAMANSHHTCASV